MSTPSERTGEHMRELEMAAYLDRRLSEPDRERAEAHLAECAECRREFREVRGLLNRSARPRRLLVGAESPRRRREPRPLPAPLCHRSAPGWGCSPLLPVYGPTGDASLASLRFVWAAAPGAAGYRLTVSGGNGIPVWSGSVTDTMFVLPDSISLGVDQRYVWIVDALLADGSARSTGLHEFRSMQ